MSGVAAAGGAGAGGGVASAGASMGAGSAGVSGVGGGGGSAGSGLNSMGATSKSSKANMDNIKNIKPGDDIEANRKDGAKGLNADPGLQSMVGSASLSQAHQVAMSRTGGGSVGVNIDGMGGQQSGIVTQESFSSNSSTQVSNNVNIKNENTTIIQDIQVSMNNTSVGFRSKYGGLFDKLMEKNLNDKMLLKILEMLQQKRLEDLIKLMIEILENSKSGTLIDFSA